jgi:hypothetical protein
MRIRHAARPGAVVALSAPVAWVSKSVDWRNDGGVDLASSAAGSQSRTS